VTEQQKNLLAERRRYAVLLQGAGHARTCEDHADVSSLMVEMKQSSTRIAHLLGHRPLLQGFVAECVKCEARGRYGGVLDGEIHTKACAL
jgi:hypothetical protein